jgi:hypothetical protein
MENNENIVNVPLGSLFETINYYSIEDLEKFIGSLTYEQALYCLVQASQAAFNRNAYTMAESEVVSKAIRKLSIHENKQ